MDEPILFETKPAPRSFLIAYVAAFICLQAPFRPGTGPFHMSQWVGVPLFFIILILVFLKWRNSVYTLTSSRITAQTGFFSVTVTELPVTEVAVVHVLRGLTSRALKVGHFHIYSKDNRRAVKFFGVPHPDEVYQKIQQAVAAVAVKKECVPG
ncbi:MAG: PH domain-containing protein [Deltaproteobacteria bacterium]|nr:PH domain-containing protein [Deltaproteobacteria bacterium]